jgi:G6PDH family F420-dependent oxidoreductase
LLRFGLDLDGGWLQPQDHIASAQKAEELGYDSVWLGDHFLPWFHTDAQSPAVWPWLGAALAKTSRIQIGPSVTVPIGGRYHPLIIGQNAATLENMFPGRFLLGVGTGQAMSEQRFLGRWPEWKERGERMKEGLELMRKLWDSEDYFDWNGKYFHVQKVYLYTRSSTRIPVIVSARGKYAARIAGALGDHLITTVSDPKKVEKEVIPEFENAFRKSGRDPSKTWKIAGFEFAIGDVDDMVRRLKNGAGAQGLIDAARGEMDPRKIQQMGSQANRDALIAHHHIVSNAEELVAPLQRLIDAGINYIFFGDESRRPIDAMMKVKEEVIPHLKG